MIPEGGNSNNKSVHSSQEGRGEGASREESRRTQGVESGLNAVYGNREARPSEGLSAPSIHYVHYDDNRRPSGGADRDPAVAEVLTVLEGRMKGLEVPHPTQ